jgi:hypothetical protein
MGRFRAERRMGEWRFSHGANFQEPDMRNIHALALTAASAAILSLSGAAAQTVSGGDPYNQGYAAGASAKERNTLNAFDSGYRAGQATQSTVQSQSAYDMGYAAGLAQANRDRQQAFNQGYEARGLQDRRVADRAFDNGFDAGAYQRARRDFP